MNWQTDYFSKFKSAEEAVKVVKSGDTVVYGEFVMVSRYLDKVFAQRVPELENVLLRSTTCPFPPAAVMADPKMEHLMYNDWHFSPASRKLSDHGLCRYVPMNYHEGPNAIRQGRVGDINVAMLMTSPPDEDGYLNLGPTSSITPTYIKYAKHIIVEINESVPVCCATDSSRLHVSQVDTFVQGPNYPLIEVPTPPPNEVDEKIAEYVVSLVEDRSCIQLGIGAMPNAVGQLIAKSGLKDLGVHTEMLCDAFVDMAEAGCITNKFKTTDPGKMVYTFATGTKKLYDFLDGNKDCLIAPVDYTNDPYLVAQNDNMVCLNNALEVDLYGQVASESSGIRQISGTGGQLDFVIAAERSKGGKGLICLSSTYTDKDGNLQSRIRPYLDPGTIVTVPRSYCPIVITEYGIADMRAKTTWERAKALIDIAHPDFREELTKAAMKLHLADFRVLL
ncbi:MAG: butyryl-CoA:acetate CoA-transferase [Oscillospiraceae bacterium]|nr:butyryl-CoA:acetate CoA-transferase [Oscillospiraceae bacterium]